MVVLITCKNEEDPFKYEGTRIFITLYINFSDAHLIIFKLASYKDMLKILDEFEFQPDLTICCRVSCPRVSEQVAQRATIAHLRASK